MTTFLIWCLCSKLVNARLYDVFNATYFFALRTLSNFNPSPCEFPKFPIGTNGIYSIPNEPSLINPVFPYVFFSLFPSSSMVHYYQWSKYSTLEQLFSFLVKLSVTFFAEQLISLYETCLTGRWCYWWGAWGTPVWNWRMAGTPFSPASPMEVLYTRLLPEVWLLR